MKKFAAILLLVVQVLVLFGCNKQSNDTQALQNNIQEESSKEETKGPRTEQFELSWGNISTENISEKHKEFV